MLNTFRINLQRDCPTLQGWALDLTLRDLESLSLDEGLTPETAYRVWLRRLGGTRNIPAYADCLVAGEERHNSR